MSLRRHPAGPPGPGVALRVLHRGERSGLRL